MKKIIALLLALAMVFALAACGSAEKPEETPAESPSASAPVETPAESEKPAEPEVPSIAGTYRFKYVDLYGDATAFTVTLKDGGAYSITTAGALGSAAYEGTWTDKGDGTFTTSALEGAPALDFAEADGTIVWKIDGRDVVPGDYVEPTEFLEKVLVTDPTNAAEAVGVYTFGMVNKFGSTVPYVVWVNADGTYAIHMNNSFTGLHTYTGDKWSVNAQGVVTFGPATFEGDTPMGDWFNADAGYTSSWQLHGDGTCEPAGYIETIVAIDLAAQPIEILPAGFDKVGVYAFGQINKFGSTVPYIVWINANGTAVIHMNNSFTGLHTYTATEWTYNEDGTVSIGALTFEGDTPMGDWFDAAAGYTSTWTLNTDGTCEPAGYKESKAPVDLAAQPAEIWPAYNSVGGVYYFGMINKFGSTVPYALVLKDDGTAKIVMDNSFTGVHAYTATEYTVEGDLVSVGALTYEGDTPMGEWFDAAAGYTSTWKLNSDGTCVPDGYVDTVVAVDADKLSDGAKAEIQG